MWKIDKQKGSKKIIFLGFVLSFLFIILTTPLHEACHWVISDIDPYVKPIEFHIFDEKSFQNGESIFSSSFGYVLVKEEYPGAFGDRPKFFDLLQELFCIFIQLVLTCFIVSKILKVMIDKKLIVTTTTN